MGWELRTRRGEEHPNASTDNHTAEVIRAERRDGMTLEKLAEKHAVSVSTVRRIIRGAYDT